MKRYFAPIFACLLTTLAWSRQPEWFILSTTPIVGTGVVEVLNASLPETAAVVFCTDDTMSASFTHSIADGKYQRFVFYDRGMQIVAETGGGFHGDYIEKASRQLGDAIDGFVVPIHTSRILQSISTAQKVLQAFHEAIKREGDFQVIFLIDYGLTRTVFRTEGYRAGIYRFAITTDLQRADSIGHQIRVLERNGQRIEDDSMVALDLRKQDSAQALQWDRYLQLIESRPPFIIFDSQRHSILALAQILDSASSTLDRRID